MYVLLIARGCERTCLLPLLIATDLDLSTEKYLNLKNERERERERKKKTWPSLFYAHHLSFEILKSPMPRKTRHCSYSRKPRIYALYFERERERLAAVQVLFQCSFTRQLLETQTSFGASEMRAVSQQTPSVCEIFSCFECDECVWVGVWLKL